MSADGAAAAWLLRLVDLGLASILFIAPLFMGGRHEIGRLVYVSVIGFTATAWSIRQWFLASPRYRWSGAEPILLAAVVLVILQLVPLPQSVLLWISPEIGELLPMWTGQASAGGSLGTWNQLSLAPMATQAGLVTLLAHVLLFLVVVQRLQDTRDIERMLKWVALASILMAGVGLAQFLFGNGKFLWIYEHPSRDTFGVAKGTFQNQNHFANFLAMGLGPLIWWLAAPAVRTSNDSQSRRPSSQFAAGIRQFPGPLLGLLAILLGVALTSSRGGVIAVGTATGISLGVFLYRRVATKRIVITMGIGAIFLAAALAIHGYQPMASRLASLAQSRSLEDLSHGRAALWNAHLKIIPRFWLSGTGTGSHAEVYRSYFEEHFEFEFTHGESGYLHLLVENGVPGMLLAGVAAFLVLSWSVRVVVASRDVRAATAAGAVAAGLAASFAHSIGDFVWYIPACMSMAIVLAATGCRLFQLNPSPAFRWLRISRVMQGVVSERSPVAPSSLRLAHTVCAAALCVIMCRQVIPAASAAGAWDRYLNLSHATKNDEVQDAASVEEMALELQHVLEADSHHPRCHLRLAGKYVQLFHKAQQASENPMALAQIRDAALASQFSDQAAMDSWLGVVLGPRREMLERALDHTRRALRLSPLQGDAYIYLGELSFLDDGGATDTTQLVAQALRVRPYNGYVLLAAGGEAAQAGDVEQALQFWKQGFHLHPSVQMEVIERLASHISSKEFLREFSPDRRGMLSLFQYYLQEGEDAQAEGVAESLLAAIQEELHAELPRSEQAQLWDQARRAYECMGDRAGAVQAASRSVALSPDHFWRHYQRAQALLANQEYDEACDEFRWCLRRRPGDGELQRQLTAATKLRVAGSSGNELR